MNAERCREILSHLTAFLREEAAPSRAAAIRRHLEACPECRAQAQHMCACLEILMAAPEPALSIEGRARVLDALKSLHKGP